jgi:hypothetical protein
MKHWILGAGALLFAHAAGAQMMGQAPAAPPPVGVRGTITDIAGSSDAGYKLSIAGKSGAATTLLLAPKSQVIASSNITLADIKPNNFIGTAAEPGPNGTLVATEVHVFAESMRGAGEGHRPWDSSKTSSMTNGNIGGIKDGGVKSKSGRTLTVDYKGGQQTVYVPPSTPIVSFGPGTPDLIVKGAHVFTFGMKQPDGSIATNRLVVGVNGSTPPM